MELEEVWASGLQSAGTTCEGSWIIIAGCAEKCDMQVPGGVSNMYYLQLQDMGLV